MKISTRDSGNWAVISLDGLCVQSFEFYLQFVQVSREKNPDKGTLFRQYAQTAEETALYHANVLSQCNTRACEPFGSPEANSTRPLRQTAHTGTECGA